jgi:hypothetical protein
MSVKNYKYNKGFEPLKENICTTDYGLCPAPMEAQVALDILSSYLLGDDWYTSLPVSVEQGNAILVEQILDKYSKKWRKDWKHFKSVESDTV